MQSDACPPAAGLQGKGTPLGDIPKSAFLPQDGNWSLLYSELLMVGHSSLDTSPRSCRRAGPGQRRGRVPPPPSPAALQAAGRGMPATRARQRHRIASRLMLQLPSQRRLRPRIRNSSARPTSDSSAALITRTRHRPAAVRAHALRQAAALIWLGLATSLMLRLPGSRSGGADRSRGPAHGGRDQGNLHDPARGTQR